MWPRIKQPLGWSMGIAVCLAGGCGPELGPDEDAILYYFRNARVKGEVRRVWPEGQKYVDAVLKADAKLQEELAALRNLQSVESLWPREDPRWRDRKAVDDDVKTLTEFLGPRSETRQALLDDLTAVVGDAPASLRLTSPVKGLFVDRIWRSLALSGMEQGLPLHNAASRLEGPVRLRLTLLKEAQPAGEGFDPDATGLKVTDAARQAVIDQHFDALKGRLDENRESFLRYAETELIAIAKMGEIENRSEREFQSARRTYLSKQMESIPKNLKNLLERAKKQQAELGEKEPSSAKGAFLAKRIEQLTRAREEFKGRVEAILEKAKQAGETSP